MKFLFAINTLKMATPSVFSLPFELSRLIFDELLPPQDDGRLRDADTQRTLKSLSETNKALRAFALPLLYRKVQSSYPNRPGSGRHICWTPLLVRTLAENPQIAALVEEVVVDDTGLDDWFDQPREVLAKWLLSEEEVKFVNRLRRERNLADVGGGGVSEQDLGTVSNEFGVLIMCLAPNVRKLSHWGDSMWENKTFVVTGPNNDAPDEPVVTFPNVTHLLLSTANTEDTCGINLAEYQGLFRSCPNLEKLELRMCNGGSSTMQFPSKLRHISLDYAIFQYHEIVALLRDAEELNEFHFSDGGGSICMDKDVVEQSFPPHILHALQPHAKALKAITIDLAHSQEIHWNMPLDDFVDFDDFDEDMPRTIFIEGPIDGFPALERLGVNWTAIRRENSEVLVTLISRLPALSNLEIYEIDGTMRQSDIDDLKSAIASGLFPQLRRVTLWWGMTHWASGVRLDATHGTSQHHGVEFVLGKQPWKQGFDTLEEL
jgi:hypothetical protein